MGKAATLSNALTHSFNVCANFVHRHFPALLPGACELCGAGSGKEALCSQCVTSLPALPPACPVCALPTPTGSVCGACLHHTPPFARTRAAFLYLPPVDVLIHSFKFGGRLHLASFFAHRMEEAIRRQDQALPDCVIPLPLAPHRQRDRGYNQAQELARRLAWRLGLPLDRHSAQRIGQAPPQSSLPWKERAKNIRGAFSCIDTVAGKRLAVVDDVMTTGATLAEFARCLKAAGASEVINWVVARTPPPTD